MGNALWAVLRKDDWQKRHIADNIPDLVSSTNCDATFLSIVRQSEAISEHDEQKLLHKSKKFYKLLMKENNRYHTLRYALEQTKQTGALEILDRALIRDVLRKLDVPLSRMSEFQNDINAHVDESSNTLLHKAVVSGGTQQLEKLKLLKADFEASNKWNFTPFLEIVFAAGNFRELLVWFKEQKFDLQFEGSFGQNLALLATVFERSKNELQLIVDSGVNWNSKDHWGQSVMHLAAKSGNIDALKYFKTLRADVNEKDMFGSTPIMQLSMAKRNFAEIFLWFVLEQTNLHEVDENGNNLVLLAASHGRSRVELKLIIDCGLDWNIMNKYGQSVMHFAAKGGNIEALEFFKSLGADINARDNLGKTPLLRIADYPSSNFTEMFSGFLSQKIDKNAVDNKGNNLALLAASHRKSKTELQLIVDSGINSNARNNFDETVLHLAAKQGNVEALQFFKNLGADVGATDIGGNTPLLEIASCFNNNFKDTFIWFSSQEIDINAVNNEGNNLVLLAASNNRISKTELQLIVDCGVQWNIRNQKGETVMHFAAKRLNIEALEFFKCLGADVSAKDAFGNTPLLNISKFLCRDFTKTINWFLSQKVDINAVNNEGNNLVFLAASYGKSKAELQLIMDRGVRWNIRNIYGQTVMHLAAQGANVAALKFFKSNSFIVL